MESLNYAKASVLDRTGIVAAFVCAVHCASAPLLAGVIPLLDVYFPSEQTEWSLVSMSVGLGMFSLLPAYLRRHRRCKPLLLFGAGLFLIFWARVWLEKSVHFELPVVVIGAVLIISAHLVNLHLCKLCAICSQDSG